MQGERQTGRKKKSKWGRCRQKQDRTVQHTLCPYMALGLRLVAILPHDLLEGDVQSEHLGHHVYAAHDELVQVAFPHEVSRANHGLLKAGPHSAGGGEGGREGKEGGREGGREGKREGGREGGGK